MTIKQLGGVFGRNPEFNKVDVKKISIESSVQPSLEINNTGSDGDILSIEKNGSAVGSLGNFSTRLYIESDGDASGLLFGSGDVSPRKNGANVSDAVSLGNTTNKFKFLYLTRNVVVGNGYGIDFSATAGAGTSELLDDYEEGTWNPVYVPQIGSFATMTMDISNAKYTKVGRFVYVQASILTDSVDITGGSGGLRLSGFPFASSGFGSFVISYAQAWGGDVPLYGYIENSSTYANLRYRTSVNGADSAMLVSDLTNGAVANQNYMIISGVYTA